MPGLEDHVAEGQTAEGYVSDDSQRHMNQALEEMRDADMQPGLDEKQGAGAYAEIPATSCCVSKGRPPVVFSAPRALGLSDFDYTARLAELDRQLRCADV